MVAVYSCGMPPLPLKRIAEFERSLVQRPSNRGCSGESYPTAFGGSSSDPLQRKTADQLPLYRQGFEFVHLAPRKLPSGIYLPLISSASGRKYFVQPCRFIPNLAEYMFPFTRRPRRSYCLIYHLRIGPVGLPTWRHAVRLFTEGDSMDVIGLVQPGTLFLLCRLHGGLPRMPDQTAIRKPR